MTCLPFFRYLLFASALLLTGALAVQAQTAVSSTDVPRTISYQGLLTSTDGTPFADGRYSITVTIYSDAQGTRRIWQDTYTTQVDGGVFNLYLGSGERALPGTDVLNTALWIGTSVDGANEMRPLAPLSASPYALNVPDRAITTPKIADGAITAEKLNVDYISAVQIDGEKISTKGTVLNLVGTPGIPLSYDEATQSVTIGELPAQTSDGEKGAEVLAIQRDLWSASGDAYRVPVGGALYVPVAGDWIGTTAVSGIAFDMRANGATTLVLQPSTTVGAINNIVGGTGNVIAAASDGSVIAGGGGAGALANTVSIGDKSAISGGESNIIAGDFDVIGGGLSNVIGTTVTAYHYGFIGSGEDNDIVGDYSSVVGGLDNSIGTLGPPGVAVDHSVIAGGKFNDIPSGGSSIIGGGESNTIEGTFDVIAGGGDNVIGTASGPINYGFIGSGQWNVVSAVYSTVGGGYANVAAGENSTIPGGDLLRTNASYAQSAMGFINAPRGTMGTRPNAAAIAASNDPLFMIGNGDYGGGNLVRSNAFEVSYNGHSTVYGINGTGATNAAIRGATYVDNVICAWGEIAANGAVVADFGVSAVAHPAVGVYDITIAVNSPLGPAVTLANASITATIQDDYTTPIGCTSITSTAIGAGGTSNTFRIRTYDMNGGCTLADFPFMFKVTGR